MQSSLKRMLVGGGFFGGTLVVAVAGYRLAGWNWLDSIYMVVITIFGVGFGEIGPMPPGLRIFTMAVIISGCTSVAYILGGFLQMITEGEIKRVLGVRRMKREIDLLTDHVIICGYGRIGQILANQMETAHQPFVLIDNDDHRVAQAEGKGFLVQMGSAADENILEAAGIMRAKFLATVLPDDAINVFITLTARVESRSDYPGKRRVSFHGKEAIAGRSRSRCLSSGDRGTSDVAHDYSSGCPGFFGRK